MVTILRRNVIFLNNWTWDKNHGRCKVRVECFNETQNIHGNVVVVVVRGGGVAFRVSARDARRSAARRRGAGARATIGARFSFAAPR